MRALNYIKNQIEYAAKGTGKITVNQNLVDAFNEVASVVNGKVPESNIEDALMLFYLLLIFKVDNNRNEVYLKENRQGIMRMSNPYSVLEDLFTIAKPKENMIDEIYTELKINQLVNKIPQEEMIKRSDVKILIEKLLNDAKTFKTLELIKAKKHTYGNSNNIR